MRTEKFQFHGLKQAHEECHDAWQFCIDMINQDMLSIPMHQREWKKGHVYSWHYIHVVNYRVAQFIHALECIVMANGKGKSRKSTQLPQYSFVRCELNSDDKKSAKIWIDENRSQLPEMLHDVMASGYKFSCTYSDEHDTFTATFSGKPEEALNELKTLTARHKDWVVATLTLLYKHQVIFKSGIWETDIDDDDASWA